MQIITIPTILLPVQFHGERGRDLFHGLVGDPVACVAAIGHVENLPGRTHEGTNRKRGPTADRLTCAAFLNDRAARSAYRIAATWNRIRAQAPGVHLAGWRG